MAYAINGVNFNIKHKKVTDSIPDLESIQEDPIAFIVENTTLNADEVVKIVEVMSLESITEFVHKQIDVESEEGIIDTMNKFSNKLSTFTYKAIEQLMSTGYKATELFSLDKRQLIEVLFLEIRVGRLKIDTNSFDVLFKYSISESNYLALKEAMLNPAKEKEQESNDDEIRNLISGLQNLE